MTICDKLLVTGPWMGEFGWEVSQWIPHLHWLVRRFGYDGHQVRVVAPSTSVILYKPLENNGVSDCEVRPYDMTHIKGQKDMHKRLRVGPKRTCKISTPQVRASGFKKWLDPQEYKVAAEKGVPVLIGRKSPAPYVYPAAPKAQKQALFVHARNIGQHRERNYDHWPALISRLDELAQFKRIFFMGTRNDWILAPYDRGPIWGKIHDLRGNLPEQLKAMHIHTGIGIGGSSGTVHLMQHCKVPIVTWSGNAGKDLKRYAEVWNPFNSPAKFLPTWQPNIDAVVQQVETYL